MKLILLNIGLIVMLLAVVVVVAAAINSGKNRDWEKDDEEQMKALSRGWKRNGE